jgi:hypothetical protein
VVKKEDYFLIVLSFFAILISVGLVSELANVKESSITGRATTSDVESSAVVSNYFAISASPNMSDTGITFDIASLPAVNVNSTGNYNVSAASETEYFMEVALDSNVNVDFCIKANASLWAAGGNSINISNYTFNNATASNITTPDFDTKMLTGNETYEPSTTNVAPSSKDYYRFWLNVSAQQAAGTYTNAINFKGLQTGSACN